MGRFEAKDERRDFGWGEVFFTNKYVITLEADDYTTIFHRYGAPKGHYRAWERFAKELKRAKIDNVYDIFRLADKFGVVYYTKKVKLASRSDGRL